ncbi:MAG: flagellar basal body P-ring formation protein FlgA [Rhodospirillales bacterium]|nr:flagellar basal body P-ring formation protein FlgA [Rhodospirillales bacterium]
MHSLPQKIDFTFRVIVLILTVTVGMMFLFVGARAAMAANLKSTAVIYGDVFTVGDLFGGLSKDMSGKVLGPAPQPGHDIVLNARTLMRIAVALDLPWRPASTADQVTLRRAATVIDTGEIKNLLDEQLRAEGLDGRFAISFSNTIAPQMILPHDEIATVEIGMMNYDSQHGKFQATLMAPSKDKPLAELAVAGKIERIIPVPVLKKTLSTGTIINAYDIDWVDIRESEIQNGLILDADALAGMTPRRMLVAGKPIRDNELERPQLVSRGDTVTITYGDKIMTLTAQGKAMQNGAKGDMIRVINLASNRTVDAFVEDEFMVKVQP